ncbi:DUF4383 domain-containing protein [Sphingosinicella sp. CPCC 101087]|uniref:DUF4383 domain-containing protein n=1 Tax=Sphingosinicella sp. CPCC 101087 TaxID=2497754 RepID=UPI00101BD396|nr:DUF4383 domain-containing protein [Sphingosinicella sp. CPCC 101087]
MSVRTFALIFGIVFLAVGAAGFVPGLLHAPHPDHPDLAVDAMYGRLLGLFPVNVLHNLVHIAFGIWGVIAYRSVHASRFYGKAVTVSYAVLTVMGLVPGLNTLFGLAPLFGHDVWLHVVLAVVAGYFGWIHRGADVRA